MFNDLTNTLSLLKTRRSGKPRDLGEPGPSAEELREILTIATRTPDHGKLHPWRFVHVAQARRDAFADLLRRAYLAGNAEPGRLEREANERFARQAPELVVVLSTPTVPHKIPVWEQQLSCGAACMNLLTAAHAMGYAGGWVTGWAAYSRPVIEALGGTGENDRIAAFIFLGTPGTALEERMRPAYEEVAGEWQGPSEVDP